VQGAQFCCETKFGFWKKDILLNTLRLGQGAGRRDKQGIFVRKGE